MTATTYNGPPTSDAATLSRLHALLGVAGLVRSHADLQPLLEQVAATVASSLGYAAVIVNLRRPAWDDFEVVVVAESEPSPAVSLLGEHVPLEDVRRLLDERFRVHGAYFIPHDQFDASGWTSTWVPESSCW